MHIGITGHRGLDDLLSIDIKRELSDFLAQRNHPGMVGVSCLADGPDSWFAESLLECGGHLEAVEPASEYRDGLPEWHHATYDALMARAGNVHRTGLQTSDGKAHMAGSEILVRLVDLLVAVWDGQPARGYGGTADVVAYARKLEVPVHVIWPPGATR